MKNPDIVDLMITLCFAACNSNSTKFNPFEPYPNGIEIKDNNNKTYNFKRDNKNDNSKVKNVIATFPKVETLQKWVKEDKLKEEMFKLNPLAYSLLRWILASNRTHLKKLKGNN
jgi:hypothetical protein